ncbi:MAG: DsbA family protein [Gemmatimonadota bacterium]|nr:DsbA family protein [Gemmatimonadota bacterium]
MSLIVYYDFTSPDSFALSEILLAMPGCPPVEWRGVQMEPGAPVQMVRHDRRAIDRLEMDLVATRRAAPDVRLHVPRGRPNTRVALQAVVAVERMHAVRAESLRTAVFRGYWWDSADLSDVATLRRLADEAGVPPWVDLASQAAQATQVGWELQWQVERLGGVPRVIREDGEILWQVESPATVARFVGGG